ncbi:10408_t:CDS:2, partial [Racocetra persica]
PFDDFEYEEKALEEAKEKNKEENKKSIIKKVEKILDNEVLAKGQKTARYKILSKKQDIFTES